MTVDAPRRQDVADFVLDTVRSFYAGDDEAALAARYRYPFPVLAPSFQTTITDAEQFIADAEVLRALVRNLGVARVAPHLVSTFRLSRDTAAVQIRRARLYADGSEQGADFSVYTAERDGIGWVLTSLAISDRKWPADCDIFKELISRPSLHAGRD